MISSEKISLQLIANTVVDVLIGIDDTAGDKRRRGRMRGRGVEEERGYGRL